MAVYKKDEELKDQKQAEQSTQSGAQGGQWKNQLDDTIDKILNREQFSYDMDSDAMYEQMKDQYIRQGQMAMMDTMGKAATMTGGYGNSYAQGVGQQTYQEYLQGFNDVVPDLYQMALDAYTREGQALSDKYAVLADKRGDELEAAELAASLGDYSLLAKYYGWTDDYMDGLVNPKQGYIYTGNPDGNDQDDDSGDNPVDDQTGDTNYYEQLLSAVAITKGSYAKQDYQTRQKAYQKTVAAINDAYENGNITQEERTTLLGIATPGGR